MTLEFEVEVAELVEFAFGATYDRSVIHQTADTDEHSVEVESV